MVGMLVLLNKASKRRLLQSCTTASSLVRGGRPAVIKGWQVREGGRPLVPEGSKPEGDKQTLGD
eukprot:1148982-Pelagomonas_calceolata.AAC.3